MLSEIEVEPEDEVDVIRDEMNEALTQLSSSFVDRDHAFRALMLAALTGNNVLFIGTPGTAKTAMVECFVKHWQGAKLFTELCGSFTVLDQLVGPTDIKAFQTGTWQRVTTGMLPDAHVAFLDEVMKSNDGTINSLLRILNERQFAGKALPLRMLAAATNWPEVEQRTENVEALYDRFVIRLEIKDIDFDDHTKFAAMLATPESSVYSPAMQWSLSDIDKAAAAVRAVTIDATVQVKLSEIRARLHKEGVDISSRRAKRMQNVLRAQAWLDGEDTVTLEQFDVLAFGFWSDRQHIPTINSILDSIDQKVVSECVKVLDAVNNRVSALMKASAAERARGAGAAIKELRASGEKVKALVDKEGCTKRGRERIRIELEKMKTLYRGLKDAAQKDHGLKLRSTAGVTKDGRAFDDESEPIG